MNSTDRAIGQLSRRIGGVLILRAAVTAMIGWCALWGVGVIVGRTALDLGRIDLAWGALGLVVAAGLGAWVGLRRMPSNQQLRAMVDRHWEAGGLVMAAAQADVDAWALNARNDSLPDVRWRGRNAWFALLAASAFVITGFALPDQVTSLLPNNQLNIDEQVTDLTAQIEALEKEQLIEENAAEALLKELDQIQSEAVGHDPTKTWEALDHVAETLARKADEAAEQAIRDLAQLSEMEAEAEAIDAAMKAGEMGEAIDGQSLSEAMKALSEMTGKAAAESKQIDRALDSDLLKQLQDLAKLDPEAAKKLAEMGAKQAQAMNEVAKQLKEIDADAMAHVIPTGFFTILTPDNATTIKQLKDPAHKLPATHAVRTTSGLILEHDPAAIVTVDVAAMGDGERIVALNKNQGLAIYQLDPAATPNRKKLDPKQDEVVFTVDPDGTVNRFVYDQTESQACGACQGGGEEVFRIMTAQARAGGQNMQQMLERLAEQGLISPEQLQQAQQAGQPGKGGINRGRADAPMTWKDPSNREGMEFKEQTLPPASLESLKNSQRIGLSVSAPDLAEDGTVTQPGALSGARAAGGSANKQTVLPQHRGAVERYFQGE